VFQLIAKEDGLFGSHLFTVAVPSVSAQRFLLVALGDMLETRIATNVVIESEEREVIHIEFELLDKYYRNSYLEESLIQIENMWLHSLIEELFQECREIKAACKVGDLKSLDMQALAVEYYGNRLCVKNFIHVV